MRWMNIFNFLWRGFFGRFSIKHDFFGVELMASLAKNEDVTQVLLQDSTTTWSTQGRIAFKICRVPPMGLIVNALSYPSKNNHFSFCNVWESVLNCLQFKCKFFCTKENLALNFFSFIVILAENMTLGTGLKKWPEDFFSTLRAKKIFPQGINWGVKILHGQAAHFFSHYFTHFYVQQ